MQRVSEKTGNGISNWVMALIVIFPVVAFLIGEAIVRGIDDPVSADLRLLQAALFMLFAVPLATQVLDRRKDLRRGPRMFAKQLRLLIVLLAMMIALRQPDATMSVGDALRDWAFFLGVIGLVSGFDLTSRLSDLRHKRRVLRSIGRNAMQIVALVVVLSATLSFFDGRTAPQTLWLGIVILAVLVSDPFLSRAKICPQWRHGHIALLTARIVAVTASFAAAFVILGVSRDPSGMLPAVVGGTIGVAVGVAGIRSRRTL